MNKKLIIFSVIFIIIIVIIIIVSRIDRGRKILFNKHDLFYEDKVEIIGYDEMPDSKVGIQYSFSVWLRTENIPGNAHWDSNVKKKKTILLNGGSPNILYNRLDNIVEIHLAYRDNEGILNTYMFELEQFKTQKWTHLVIIVDNRNVTIYKDGELLTARKIPNVNLKNYKLLTLGEKNNNFNGYVGYLEYYNYPLNGSKIKSIYKKYKKNYLVML